MYSAFHSRFNRRVQINHPNIWSFIKFLQGEENRFHRLSIQFHAGLGTRPKPKKTIAIQRRIDNLSERYYDGSISAMEYLDGLSFIVAKRKKISFYSFIFFSIYISINIGNKTCLFYLKVFYDE